jgi:hypothetical protein
VSTLPEDGAYYLQSGYGQVGLLLNASAGNWASAKADLRFKYGSEFQQTVSEVFLREAYVDLSSQVVGLRFGKLITPWGKGTAFNPTDKLTPLDPTTRSPDEDDMLLGIWAFQGRINLGSFIKLTGTWKPLYQSSVLLIDPVPMPGYVEFLEPWNPGVTLAESSYGINLDLHLPAIDAALYWFEGYHHWPGIAFESFALDSSSMEPSSLQLREHPYRIRMAGLDLSIPMGSWIFRMEGAWQQSIRSHEEYEYVPFPELAYTAEIERSLSIMDVVAGYYGKYIMDFAEAPGPASLSAEQEGFSQLMNLGISLAQGTLDGLISDQIGAFNRLYNYQLEEMYHTAFLILRGNLLHDLLECSLPVIYNFTTEEWIVQPRITYHPLDGLELSAGFSGFYGPGESLYDLVGPVLNAGYLSIKLTF